ncbi:helix-turn-helix domain-containing protein [Butyrivibrio proteoclasticus]|uniref:helix-turn-helix domain-containing protein n=1 Tax=Butyrivibrio proteoclasticus TaxID=43305 RepID=UPI00047A104E|nr:helix-turn-helix transcriptional regulator [Butyrivibrio proteoclasticus]
MGRKRIIQIEKEENRKSAEAFLKVVGDRSYKEAAEDAGIDPSTLSYICRGKVKPTPDVITAITSPEANPQGGIGVEELLIECGYQSSTTDRLVKYMEALGKTVDKQTDAAELMHSAFEAQKVYERKCVACRMKLMQAIIDKGYSIHGNYINVTNHSRVDQDVVGRLDAQFGISDTGTEIKCWNFCFDLSARDLGREGWLYTTSVFGELLGCGPMDEYVKLSYVTMNKQHYDSLCRYEGIIPFRGELSIILMDNDCEEILEEKYISNYIEGDKSCEFTIVK